LGTEDEDHLQDLLHVRDSRLGVGRQVFGVGDEDGESRDEGKEDVKEKSGEKDVSHWDRTGGLGRGG
jgi:hypothetical protein